MWTRDTGAKFKEPTVIVGIPDVGLVGTIACSYLVDALGLVEIGHMDSDLMPPVITVSNGAPSYPIRIFAKDEVVIVISSVPLFTRLGDEFTKEVVNWSKAHNAGVVIGVTGLPSKEREDSQAEQEPFIVGVTNDENGTTMARSLGIRPLEDGVLTGGYANLLKHCMDKEQSCLILLAESLLSFPDPGAAASVVEVLAKKLSVKIDIKPLLQESEEIRLRSRDLIQQTQQMAQQEQATMPGALPGVYR